MKTSPRGGSRQPRKAQGQRLLHPQSSLSPGVSIAWPLASRDTGALNMWVVPLQNSTLHCI